MSNNKKEENIKHINKRIIIVILLLFITIASSTFAWFTFSSRKSALVLTIGNINQARVVLKPYQIKSTLEPVNVYTDGVYTEVEAINNDDDSIVLSLYYKINELSYDLINNGLKYTVAKSETKNGEYTKIETGDFTGNLINEEIFNKIISPHTTEYYRVYLWLDSSVGDQSLVQGLKLDLELNGRVEHNGVKPQLEEGMIPVTISNNGTVKAIDKNDTRWYNYSNKEWANAVLALNEYEIGSTIPQSDIKAYFVWIPRYKYSISNSVKCSDIGPSMDNYYSGCYSYKISDSSQNTEEDLLNYAKIGTNCTKEELSKGLSNGYIYCSMNNKYIQIQELINNYNKKQGSIHYIREFHPERTISSFGQEKPINIIFEDRNTQKSNGTATGNNYLTHPAFTYNGQELNGIWVGKFETTGDEIHPAPTILPNLKSLTGQNVSEQFETGTMFDVANKESHMMKNSEWGAVAYISHSQYGINEQININNYYNGGTLTGCGASTKTASTSTTCEIKYGESEKYPQSTTGNISGIFDMSGGTWEYVMGNYENTIASDGFSNLPHLKYYDLYTGSDLSIYKGHALEETKNWYGSMTGGLETSYPWYLRGSQYNGTSSSGIFAYATGSGLGAERGFRIVLPNTTDIYPPTCKINLTEGSNETANVTVTYSDDSNKMAYYGWDDTYSGTNSTTKTIESGLVSEGIYTYYVKDAAGNTNTCNVDVKWQIRVGVSEPGESDTTSLPCPDGYIGIARNLCAKAY